MNKNRRQVSLVRDAVHNSTNAEVKTRSTSCIKDIYYQPQHGGQCRRHALNGFFGRDEITGTKWAQLKTEYDEFANRVYNNRCSCSSYDLISAGCETIICWILTKYGICTRFEPFRSVATTESQSRIDALALVTNIITHRVNTWVFVFNEGHIWGIRYVEGYGWFKVDSMSGVNRFSIATLRTSAYGLIIPVDAATEFKSNHSFITTIAGATRADWIAYLRGAHANGEVLGAVELPMARAVKAVWSQQSHNEAVGHPKKMDTSIIATLVKQYHEFMSLLTDGRYMDIELILANIPNLLEWLDVIGQHVSIRG